MTTRGARGQFGGERLLHVCSRDQEFAEIEAGMPAVPVAIPTAAYRSSLPERLHRRIIAPKTTFIRPMSDKGLKGERKGRMS
jgi:hypothetical protein